MTIARRERTEAEIAEAYARQEELLKAEIDALNKELGLPTMDTYDAEDRGITYGYIGNGTFGRDGWNLDNVIWYVFLPHPGRVGKANDSIGGFKTGSLKGVVGARSSFAAFAQGVRFAKGL